MGVEGCLYPPVHPCMLLVVLLVTVTLALPHNTAL